MEGFAQLVYGYMPRNCTDNPLNSSYPTKTAKDFQTKGFSGQIWSNYNF